MNPDNGRGVPAPAAPEPALHAPGRVPAPRPELAQAVIQQFIDLQRQELEVRRQGLELQGREIDVGHIYAMNALEAQARDRTEARAELRRHRRDRLYFLGFGALLVMAFFVYLLQTGRDGFAGEVMKAIIFLLSGGAGGYYAGKMKAGDRPEPAAGG